MGKFQLKAGLPSQSERSQKLFFVTHSFRDRCLLKALVRGKGGKTRTVPVIDDEFLSDLKHLLGNRTSGPVFAGPTGKALALPRINYIRNYQRGHWALKGKPAISRLREQNWIALPSILNQLEEYAKYEIGEKRVNEHGYIRILGRPAYLGRRFRRRTIKCFETFHGLEMRKDGFVIGTLAKYQEHRR